jgi:membrane-associated PAP2 superfamily phosphatase
MLLSRSKSRIGAATAEGLALAAGALLLIAVSGLTPLDSSVRAMLSPLGSRLFSPALPSWTFAITTGLLTVGLLSLMSGRTHRTCRARAECWRGNGIFLILLVLLGPALADSLGLASSCAGFYAAAGWWIGRRRHPGWALASLAVGLALPLVLGLSGLASGGLRLSEILWSGLAILGLAHALYYYVLRLPLHAKPINEPSTLSNRLDVPARLPGLPAMCLLLVAAAVVRLPHDARLARLHWVAQLDHPGSVHLRLR